MLGKPLSIPLLAFSIDCSQYDDCCATTVVPHAGTVCDGYSEHAETEVSIEEQRAMFELCDCNSDGSIDLCDFLSM